MQIQGVLTFIGDLQQPTATFTKRDFAIQVTETSYSGESYSYSLAFQLTNDKAGLLDSTPIGTPITVHFNARSNRSEKNGVVRYFTNLTAWKIEGVAQPQAPQSQQPYTAPVQQPAPGYQAPAGGDDDLPF